MAEKRAQTALEFLMTYGWAIIVVLVAIGALVYFGILDLSIFFPSKCLLPSGISCLDFDVSTSTVTVALQNNIGETISLDRVVVAGRESVSCTYNTPLVLRNRERATITLTNCNHGSAGKRFDGEINVTYTNLDTQLSHKSVGDIVGKLAEGPPVPCTLTSVSLTSSCSGSCGQSETVAVNAVYFGDDCPATAYVVVNANNGGNCLIQYSGGDMQGIHATCSASGSCGSWTVPSIASDCSGQTVTAQTGSLYKNGYPGTGTLLDDTGDAGDSASGSFAFETVAPPGSYADFVCPSLVAGVNDLSADPIQVWHEEYGNNMPGTIASGGYITCNCPAGTTMDQITYLADTQLGVNTDYLEVCGVRYTQFSGTVGCGSQGANFKFKSNSATSYNDGSTQYEGGKVTMINCVTPAPPPEATIKVAVEQHPSIGDADAGADDVVNQLNDNNYGYGFGAVKVSGTNIDSASELNNYDVVVIGSSGWALAGYEDYDTFDNALQTWVNNGGGVVATGEIVSDLNPFTDEGIVNILPVSVGSTLYGYGISITDAAHPVTQGVSNFATYYSSTCPMPGNQKSGSSTLGTCTDSPQPGTPGIVVWSYGNGRVVYIGSEYMRGSQSYSDLYSGEADQLMEQAVKWANG